MNFKFTITWHGPFAAKVKEMKAFTRRALGLVGEAWVKKDLRRHFGAGAAARYGYKARTRRYMKRKRAAMARGWWWDSKRKQRIGVNSSARHPLVLTGRMKAMVTAAPVVRSWAKRFRVTMVAPYYVNFRGRGGSGRDMRKEITAITSAEADALMPVFEKSLAEDLNRPTPVVRRRIG